MKKSLVLAMAMALGVTASAYAANPFSDVPAGHWAYDSINKLAAAGVIEGYGDTTFGGDKLMTRYEMAQIVAKAMAKGANVDKLAAEFADELDNLGVRVANLEKKADNVKVTGEMRYKYMSKQGDANVDKDGNHNSFENDLRSRIWVTGQINDDWSYTGMIENTQYFYGESANKGDEDTSFQRAYVEGKIGGLNVTAGRYNAFFANGNIYDARVDGAEVSYGDKVKVTGFAGKGTDAAGTDAAGTDAESNGTYAGGELSANFNKLNVAAGYVNFTDIKATSAQHETDLDDAIWYVGADYTMGDVNLSAMYLKGDKSLNGVDGKVLDDDGWTVGLTYKGAEASEAGSWGLFANYYDLGGQTYIAHTTDANTFDNDGFKGYGVGANYTFAKNIVGTVAYYDTESKLDSKTDDQRVWADVTFTF
ncbi:MAG: S-layer homology domain-containing protein [Phascolarctobacterium succinatutens]|uniref:S-layer homology domain-containing protein n=1 Tax=Phascolarctobacterium succinatutens TaxID=626940 RepID=UPI002E767611|nr:S-layer homology domain-containing protein [Phascolarctobacterium succinatutens]MEE0356210.1 S-layer homology domain-containing protein [Phascolarctobacterium succinatutens]